MRDPLPHTGNDALSVHTPITTSVSLLCKSFAFQKIHTYKMTKFRILDNAIHHPVDAITLSQHLIVNQASPDRGIDERRRISSARLRVKRSAPGGHVVEVRGWGPNKDAIKVFRRDFGCVKALPSTARAAQVVGLGIRSVVERLAQGLSCFSDDMEPRVPKLISRN